MYIPDFFSKAQSLFNVDTQAGQLNAFQYTRLKLIDILTQSAKNSTCDVK